MRYKFAYVNEQYTGGGIYIYTGMLANQDIWFIADDDWNVRFVDDDPDEDMASGSSDRTGDVEWQEKHIICDLTEKSALAFMECIFMTILDGSPNDIEFQERLSQLRSVMHDRIYKEESKPYREWFNFVSQCIDNMEDDDEFTITFRGRTIKYGLSPASYDGIGTFINNILDDIRGEY